MEIIRDAKQTHIKVSPGGIAGPRLVNTLVIARKVGASFKTHPDSPPAARNDPIQMTSSPSTRAKLSAIASVVVPLAAYLVLHQALRNSTQALAITEAIPVLWLVALGIAHRRIDPVAPTAPRRAGAPVRCGRPRD